MDRLVVGCCSCQLEGCEFCGGLHVGDVPDLPSHLSRWDIILANQYAAAARMLSGSPAYSATLTEG